MKTQNSASDSSMNQGKYYHITGTFKGRRFYYPTSDYELALKIFTVNNFKSLWEVDKNGKRKILKTNKETV